MSNYYMGEVIEVMSSRNYGCAAFTSRQECVCILRARVKLLDSLYSEELNKNSREMKCNVIPRVACSLIQSGLFCCLLPELRKESKKNLVDQLEIWINGLCVSPVNET